MSTGRIGTDNLQQCIGVVLYDSVTKKTALSHVDHSTTPESLNDVITTHFKGIKEIKVFLVGASDNQSENASHSHDNINKVREVLALHNNVINIEELRDEKVKAFVFDIDSGTMHHLVPGKLEPSTAARKCLVQAADASKELHEVFNFIKEPGVIKAPKYSDEQLTGILKSAFNSKVSTEAGMRSSEANISWPIIEFAEEIKKTRPDLVEKFVQDVLGTEKDGKKAVSCINVVKERVLEMSVTKIGSYVGKVANILYDQDLSIDDNAKFAEDFRINDPALFNALMEAKIERNVNAVLSKESQHIFKDGMTQAITNELYTELAKASVDAKEINSKIMEFIQKNKQTARKVRNYSLKSNSSNKIIKDIIASKEKTKDNTVSTLRPKLKRTHAMLNVLAKKDSDNSQSRI